MGRRGRCLETRWADEWLSDSFNYYAGHNIVEQFNKSHEPKVATLNVSYLRFH